MAGTDPDVQDEPTGWKERVGYPRRAPQRDPALNVDRCDHGRPVMDPCEVCDPTLLAR